MVGKVASATASAKLRDSPTASKRFIIVFISGGSLLQTSSFISKAIKDITRIEWAQVVHYMRATGTPFGLLINFGRPQLQYDTFDKESLPSIFDEERRSGGSFLQMQNDPERTT